MYQLMIIRLLLVFPALLNWISNSGESDPIFWSGFEPGSEIEYTDKWHHLIGIDQSTGFSWSEFKNYSSLLGTNLLIRSDSGYNITEFVDDQDPERGKVLHFVLNGHGGINPVPRTTASFDLAREATQIGVRFKYKVPSNWSELSECPDKTWLLVIEPAFTNRNSSDKSTIPLFLVPKDGQLFWELVHRKWPDGKCCSDKPFVKSNMTFPVPMGRWMTVTYFIKEGPVGTGRFYLQIDDTVVFDIRDEDFSIDDDLEKITLWKLYAGAPYIDFMTSRGTPLECWYDDIEIWDGMPKKL